MTSPCFECGSATYTCYGTKKVWRECCNCGWHGYYVKIPEVIR